jgi:hypothetical protein
MVKNKIEKGTNHTKGSKKTIKRTSVKNEIKNKLYT